MIRKCVGDNTIEAGMRKFASRIFKWKFLLTYWISFRICSSRVYLVLRLILECLHVYRSFHYTHNAENSTLYGLRYWYQNRYANWNWSIYRTIQNLWNWYQGTGSVSLFCPGSRWVLATTIHEVRYTLDFVPDVSRLLRRVLYKIVYTGLLAPLSLIRPYRSVYMKTRNDRECEKSEPNRIDLIVQTV